MANPLYGAIGEFGRTFRNIGQSGLDYEIKKAEQDWRIGQAEWKKGQTEKSYADQALQRQAQDVLNQKVIDEAARDRQPFYVLENIKKGLDDPRRPMGTTEKVAGGKLMSKILPDVVRSVFGGRLKRDADGRAVVSRTLPDGTEEIVTEGEFRRPEIQKALGYAISSQYSGLRSLRIKAASGDKEAEKQLAGINSTRKNKMAFLEKELAHKRKMRDEAGAMGMSTELYDKGIAATERDIDRAMKEVEITYGNINGKMWLLKNGVPDKQLPKAESYRTENINGETWVVNQDGKPIQQIGTGVFEESRTDVLDRKSAETEYNKKQGESRALKGGMTDDLREYIMSHSVEDWKPQSGFETQDQFLTTQYKNRLNAQLKNLGGQIDKKPQRAVIATPGKKIKRPPVPEVVPEQRKVVEKPRQKPPVKVKKAAPRKVAERIMALYAKDSPEAESLAIEFKERYSGPEHKEARDWFEKQRKPYIEAFIGGKITEKSPEYYTLKDAPEIVVNVLKRIKADNSEERLKRVQEDFSESVESGFGDFKDFKRIWEGLGMIGEFTKEEFGYFLEQLGRIPLPIKK